MDIKISNLTVVSPNPEDFRRRLAEKARRRTPPHQARFSAAYALLGFCVLALVALFAAGLKMPNDHHSQVRHSQACESPVCAQIGDTVTYTLHGRVSQVSEPQAGVVCVQVSARSSGGDKCVLK